MKERTDGHATQRVGPRPPEPAQVDLAVPGDGLRARPGRGPRPPARPPRAGRLGWAGGPGRAAIARRPARRTARERGRAGAGQHVPHPTAALPRLRRHHGRPPLLRWLPRAGAAPVGAAVMAAEDGVGAVPHRADGISATQARALRPLRRAAPGRRAGLRGVGDIASVLRLALCQRRIPCTGRRSRVKKRPSPAPPGAATAPRLYKVLQGDRSCHGGTLTWPLPTAHPDGTWTPGAWVEVEGPLAMCQSGLHLTREPIRWHLDGSQLYEAESEGEVLDDGGEKVCCRRVRLLRAVPWSEHGVYHDGTH